MERKRDAPNLLSTHDETGPAKDKLPMMVKYDWKLNKALKGCRKQRKNALEDKTIMTSVRTKDFYAVTESRFLQNRRSGKQV